MSGIRLEGNVSGNVAEVDSNNNQLVNLPTTINDAGYVTIMNEIDPGSITGSPLRRSTYVSHNFRQRSGIDTAIFDYFFTATAQDTGVWKCAITSAMTASQSGGFLLLNASSVLTSGAGISLSTWRTFALEARGGLHVRMDTLMTSAPLTNQVNEFGLFLPTTSTAPADGVYFRVTSAGVQGIINYNGTETSTGVVDASLTISATNTFAFEVYADAVEFYINGILYQVLETPNADSEPFISVALPITFQTRNSGTVSGSPVMQFKVGSCHVDFLEIQTAMPYSHQQAAEGLTAQQIPQGGTMGGSTNIISSGVQVPAAGVVLAAGVAAGTGLGGLSSGFPISTLGTYGLLFSYQVPAASTSLPGRILMITGVKIMSIIGTTLTGGPGLLMYSLAFGHTAITTTTGESASFATGTTKKPRLVPLGMEYYAATAASGTMANTQGIYMPFNSPIAVNPGEFVAIFCSQLIGTAITAGQIVWTVTYDAYWI